jgi:serine phosphatase RsbU (regulator of sigma subunit)
MQFFLSTDGYLDQNGGDKGFPFGKKKFSEIITNNQNETFADVQEILMETLMEYQKDEDRNDDVTVIGIKI